MRTPALLIVVGTLMIGWAVALFVDGNGSAGVWIGLIGAFALVRGIGDRITGATPDETMQRRVRFQLAVVTVAAVVGAIGGVLLVFGVYGPNDEARYVVGGIMVLIAVPAGAALIKEFRGVAARANETGSGRRGSGPTT